MAKGECGMGGQKRILVVGNGGAGKDTACLHLAAVTRLRFVGTTSLFLASRVAARLGVSPEEAYRSDGTAGGEDTHTEHTEEVEDHLRLRAVNSIRSAGWNRPGRDVWQTSYGR
jgi:hypothetical protein